MSYHIAKDKVPAATVEQVRFKNLLKTMDPRYELPSLTKLLCMKSTATNDHTGEHIVEALQNAIASWKLYEKYLVAITTNNGSNIVKAVELNEWLRMQSFGHRLHLAIGHGASASPGPFLCARELKADFRTARRKGDIC
ncbi:hypothetical protein FQN60_016366 [Etheostoma spectabile]|uniref:DUF659 domain-containing protein n=1 Tax=Etheostoma spectabile TaxID=54343 RepID=A0A5J5D2C6_9PERO|nr:hypothetical protein FQN60_016366 [Etheostoma spectabile]